MRQLVVTTLKNESLDVSLNLSPLSLSRRVSISRVKHHYRSLLEQKIAKLHGVKITMSFNNLIYVRHEGVIIILRLIKRLREIGINVETDLLSTDEDIILKSIRHSFQAYDRDNNGKHKGTFKDSRRFLNECLYSKK